MKEGAAKSGPLRESKKQANRVLAENAVSESEDDSDSENESNAARNHENLGNEPIKLGPQKYGCPFCSKIMQQPSWLKRHILIHTGEKPFQCKHCVYAAKRNSQLDRHILSKHILKTKWKVVIILNKLGHFA